MFAPNIEIINKPFEELIGLLNIHMLQASLRNSLYNCIAVVVTCAKNKQNVYFDRLKYIESQLKGNTMENLRYRSIIVEILSNIIKSNRIEIFTQAKEGKINDESDIFQKLKDKRWESFDLKNINEKIKTFLKIPYNKDYEELRPL